MGDPPDFPLVEQTLVERLRERGCGATRDGQTLITGLAGLTLERGETQVLVPEGHRAYGHVEFNVTLDHPVHGRHLISDLVSLDAETPDALLAECADLYVEMTLDPLLALFDEKRFAEPTNRLIVVTAEEASHWHVFNGRFDLRGQDAAAFNACLGDRGTVSLVAGTLAGHLRQPRLHWLKVYGESQGDSLRFGCILDGRRSGDGEREMPAVLQPLPPPPADWAFRNFVLFVPHGEPDPAQVESARAELFAATGGPPKRKPAWWPFGKSRGPVMWRIVA